MPAREILSAVAKAELDRTLEALAPRVLFETAVLVGVAVYVPVHVLKKILERKKIHD